MKFSIIIPLYNKALYVAKALESVFSQSFTDFEIILVDDGSKDDSAEIAMQCILGHENCRLLKQENAGVSVARNNGVEVSKGDNICFLDADDWWSPNFLEEMSNLMREYPEAGIYGTGYMIVNETRHKTRVSPIGVEPSFEKGYIDYCKVYAKTLAMPLWTGAVCIPRPVFDESGGFQPGIKMGEDFLLWMHIALKYKVAFLNKPLAYYNQDVDLTNRGVRTTGFEPSSFMTFYFDQFSEEEHVNKDVKILLDRLRVFSLLRFRLANQNVKEVDSEINKVDFSNVDRKYLFYYKTPYPFVWLFVSIKKILSKLKKAMK